MLPSPKPTVRSIALGVFVLVQFIAIFTANVAGFLHPLPDIPAPQPQGVAGDARYAVDRYLEATGQPQFWGMFENGYLRNSVAWDVRIELPDGHVERVQGVAKLPGDVGFWNPPAVLSRRFVYESSLLGHDLTEPEENLNDTALMAGVVERNNGLYLAFFRAIYDRERQMHPEWPATPAKMELAILRVPTFNPREPNDTSSLIRYVARWRPELQDALPVEAYDLTQPDEPWRRFPKP